MILRTGGLFDYRLDQFEHQLAGGIDSSIKVHRSN